MAIRIGYGRLLARLGCLIVITMDGTGVAWAQLPYTPLTTPLQGGSASQPPSVGESGGQAGGGKSSAANNNAGNISSGSAPGGGNSPATTAPGASAAFTPQGAPTGGGLAQRGLEFKPRVLVRESYSDNINLAPSNHAEADFITEIVPGLDIRANGKRVQASLDYSLQGVLYGVHGGSDHVNNQVTSQAFGTILPQHLFLSADTTYTKAVINPALPGSVNGFLATGNTTNAWIAKLNPYWLQRLGPVGKARIGYTFDNIQYSGGNLSNTHSNTYKASLTSPSGRPGRWSWSGDYRHYRGRRSDGYQTTQQDVSAQLGYRVFDHITLLADGGWEQNRQKKKLYSSNFQGSYWAAGFRWRTPLNSLTFKYGHRFFGPTYDASWTHRAARLTTKLAYKETVTQVSQNLASEAVTSAQPSSGQKLPNVPLGQLNSYGLYVSRRFSGSVRYAFSRTSLGVTGYNERRHYLGRRADEHVSGATLDGRWKAGPRTSVRPSFTWEHDQTSGGAPFTLISPQLAVRYQLSRNARAEAGYRFEERQSHAASERYQMNMIYFQVSVSF